MRKVSIEPDDFEEWMAHPITERLIAMSQQWRDRAKEQWVRTSWDGQKADDRTLTRLLGQAEAFETISNLTVEALNDEND